MQIRLARKAECCGCGACANRCPHSCIAMTADEEGFFYPQIDSSQCVSCGLCERVCPVLYPVRGDWELPTAYGVRANDKELRLKSSSGGVFSLLAEKVLDSDGVVFGAAITDDCMTVQHIAVTEHSGLNRLRGSKYLQSEIGDIYRQVREQLEASKQVLFTGTPCQIDGLKGFLTKDYANLLCMEVICHGVPSPLLWQRYIDYMGKKSGASIRKADFRHKKLGWEIYSMRLENSKRRVRYRTLHKDPYLRMFLKDLCLRPSCYQCSSKGLDRHADLTVGDFWGIDTIIPELNDDKGTSLVLVHTEQGARAFADILANIEARPVDCMKALAGNPTMLRSVAKSAGRETFFADLEKMSFQEVTKKYAAVTWKECLARFLQELGLFDTIQRLRGKC